MATPKSEKSPYATRRENVTEAAPPDELSAREAAALFRPDMRREWVSPGGLHYIIHLMIVARSKEERQVAGLVAYRKLAVGDAARELGIAEGRCRDVYDTLVERLRQAHDRHHRDQVLARNGVE